MLKNKRLTIGDTLVQHIKDKFPADAEISSYLDGHRLSYVAHISWILKSDPKRPNKPSKIILIIIPNETLDDLDYDNKKELVDNKFKAYITQKLNDFDPEHNEPQYTTPPITEWIIYNGELN